jgi:hypothetical protein
MSACIVSNPLTVAARGVQVQHPDHRLCSQQTQVERGAHSTVSTRQGPGVRCRRDGSCLAKGVADKG